MPLDYHDVTTHQAGYHGYLPFHSRRICVWHVDESHRAHDGEVLEPTPILPLGRVGGVPSTTRIGRCGNWSRAAHSVTADAFESPRGVVVPEGVDLALSRGAMLRTSSRHDNHSLYSHRMRNATDYVISNQISGPNFAAIRAHFFLHVFLIQFTCLVFVAHVMSLST